MMSSEEPRVVIGTVEAMAQVTITGKARVTLGAESYRRLASGNGRFQVDNLEKVIRLGAVLHEIYRHPTLGTKLALKGGTALNLMREPIRRLSVDLDFNYVGAVDLEGMQADKSGVIQAIREVGNDLGYSSDNPREEHGGSKLSFRYTNSVGTPDQIKVDLNWITRVPLGPLQRLAMWQPDGVERPFAQLVCTEELIVGKLRALIDRSAARDVFDACNLPPLMEGEWPSPRLKALFVLYTGTLPLPLTEYGADRVDRLSQREFDQQLVPVLTVEDIPARTEIIEKAKEVLRPMLKLSESEIEFVTKLQTGDFRPDLLFPLDMEFADQIKRHPALLWKATNAREHATRGSIHSK